jgi:phenylpropionate dioxygenase-like ring-hydroxylating dioxygenase large terminal subunit
VILPGTADWYVACESTELGNDPRRIDLFDTPLVFFRPESGPVGALLDNCPHRGAPLSLGKVTSGLIECAYHGWSFSSTGVCQRVPGLIGHDYPKSYHAVAYPVVEQDGYIWVFGEPVEHSPGSPPRIPLHDDPDYLTVREGADIAASVFDVAENVLDVPHTAFLHGGLFRSDRATTPRRVVVTRSSRSVEAEYFDEQSLSPFVTKLLTSGQTIQHVDRFIPPATLQVEYRFGPKNHLLVISHCTPTSPHRTRLFATIRLKSVVPHLFLKLILRPIFRKILRQDTVMLEAQTANTIKTGQSTYRLSEIDILSPHIKSLMLAHQEGIQPEEPVESVKTLQLGL